MLKNLAEMFPETTSEKEIAEIANLIVYYFTEKTFEVTNSFDYLKEIASKDLKQEKVYPIC